jgi:hypothetical protein
LPNSPPPPLSLRASDSLHSPVDTRKEDPPHIVMPTYRPREGAYSSPHFPSVCGGRRAATIIHLLHAHHMSLRTPAFAQPKHQRLVLITKGRAVQSPLHPMLAPLRLSVLLLSWPTQGRTEHLHILYVPLFDRAHPWAPTPVSYKRADQASPRPTNLPLFSTCFQQ